MNNRGWLHIVEASIAILFVLSVLFVLYIRAQKPIETNLDEKARGILAEMALNSTIRELALDGNEEGLSRYARAYVPAYLSYELRLCEVREVCGKSNYDDSHEVFAAERVISADIQSDTEDLRPKKIRLFMWINDTA